MCWRDTERQKYNQSYAILIDESLSDTAARSQTHCHQTSFLSAGVFISVSVFTFVFLTVSAFSLLLYLVTRPWSCTR